MPGGNRTGPMGQGPRTGRGAGYCNGAAVPGSASAPGGGGMRGRGRGGGGGGGRGWRNIFHATGLTRWQREMAAEPVPPVTPAPPVPPSEPVENAAQNSVEQELASLQAQAATTAVMLEEIRQRIDEIAATKSQEASE